MTQEKRNPADRQAALWLCLAAAVLAVAASLVAAGCRRDALPASVYVRPGAAPCDYWVWSDFPRQAFLAAAAPMNDRWSEFLKAAADHRTLVYDFQFLEGHPEAVQPTWNSTVPPKITQQPWISYRSAGRWTAATDHFAPHALSLFYLRLPEGTRIDTSDHEAWRYPVGAEIVQLLYRRDAGRIIDGTDPVQEQRAVLVEWRLMRMAGPQRGQLRTDGSRSDWVFESAVRDPADRLWQRTRQDKHDVRWTRMGRSGNRFDWPVIRPHTCAECHRMAGRSPLDGPRGGNDVYSVGDLREIVWTDQLNTFLPLVTQPPTDSAIAGAREQPMPPDRAERFDAYIHELARERGKDPVIVRAQQRLIDVSPFRRGDGDAVARGRDIFLSQCAACHGADARGNGPLPWRRRPAPALVGLGAKRLLPAIRRGRGNMPAFVDTLPGDDQWRLIEYLQTLAR